jgi:hypothetical protein
MSDNENQYEDQSEAEEAPLQNGVPANPKQGLKTMQRAPRQPIQPPKANKQQIIPGQGGGRQYGVGQDVRTWPIRESRIKDRPAPKELKDSSLKIKIELDLEVEVDLYARVRGDVTIGLM